MKAWQRGYELAWLRRLADHFRAAERGRTLGAFSAVNEAWIAERLSEGRLMGGPELGFMAALSWPRRSRPWKAHGGRVAAELPAEHAVIERLACAEPGAAYAALAPLAPSALLALLPDPNAAQVAVQLGLVPVGSRVSAASEITGCWARFPRWRADRREDLNIAPLCEIDGSALAAQIPQEGWAQHYSSYNRRRSWTAMALRGFGDEAFVEKPAEMSRRWRDEHPELLGRACADTPLRARLPAVEPIIEALGSPRLERVRLMALDPGGGELARHADLTDHDAGIQRHQLCRLHVPLITNPGVEFTTWRLSDGGEQREHMAAGSAWLLDHTKPHAAINGGASRRIHLVIDAWVDRRLDELIGRAA